MSLSISNRAAVLEARLAAIGASRDMAREMWITISCTGYRAQGLLRMCKKKGPEYILPFVCQAIELQTNRMEKIFQEFQSKLTPQSTPFVIKDATASFAVKDFTDFKAFFATGVLVTLLHISPPEACEEQPQAIKGHFYKIKDSAGITRGYLLGSVHCLNQSIMNLNERINKAIAKSDRVFLETVEYEALNADMEKRVSQILQSESEESIQRSVATYLELLKNFLLESLSWDELKAKCDNLSSLDALKLCMKQYEEARHCELGTIDSAGRFITGIDDLVLYKFKDAGKRTLSLEPVETHTLERAKYDLRDGILSPSLAGFDSHTALVSESCKEWALGEDIAEYENDPSDAERSQAFSEAIYKDLTENLNSRGSRGFYVVGKNHLFDQKGIIKNLKLQGFSIQKIQ